MKPPIVIIEGNDISVHPSVEHVITFLEPQDVNDGIITAYDSEGRPLGLVVKPTKRERRFLWFRWFESYLGIIITEHEPVTDGSVELRRKLIGYLNAISKKRLSKSETLTQTASLDELIQASERYMPWRPSRLNAR